MVERNGTPRDGSGADRHYDSTSCTVGAVRHSSDSSYSGHPRAKRAGSFISWASRPPSSWAVAHYRWRLEWRLHGGCGRAAASGDGYQTIHGTTSHFWGAPVTIRGIEALGRGAHANGLPPLLIGDISLPTGGPMPGGRITHQVGLDVDVAIDMRMRGYLSHEQSESFQIASLVGPDYRDLEPSMWGEPVVRCCGWRRHCLVWIGCWSMPRSSSSFVGQ
jgi:hypothetical protein